ncbi:MAG TPA: L,D-transpeptidase family protein [Treponemataceae bacterium]|nr:L,D-transpeptidase family protein [Treponemataceae bacterium]
MKRLTVAKCFLAFLCLFSATHVEAEAQGSSAWTVEVSVAEQRVRVRKSDEVVRTMICSTGIPGTDDATPTGDYTLNESGAKRGLWFYSEKYGEGARYWVGFIGGTYLFHSVPMDKNGAIIEAEARKLGKPASHGCVRLSLENARWFYETVPSGARVRVVAGPLAATSASAATAPAAKTVPATGTSSPVAGASKADVSFWLAANMGDYRQKYTLSCEIALIRLSLAIAGVGDLTEDAILAAIPKGKDPETSFVCDDITAGRRNKDGSVHWDNYGTHAPVVAKAINGYLAERGIASFESRELKANDEELRALVSGDPSFRGAVVWLVGHPERWGANPPVNERGMVLGEHVRFLEPTLAPNGDFRIRDPETGKLIESRTAGASRKLFSFRVVGLFAKDVARAQASPLETGTPAAPQAHDGAKADGEPDGSGRISRGAPTRTSRTGAMLSLGNGIRSLIAAQKGIRGLAPIALLALAYGVLHALGPGHQKTLVSGYLISEGGGLGTALAASGIASASHAASVIGLFALLALIGSGLGVMDVTRAGNLVTVVSGGLLIALSLIMVYRRLTGLIAALRGEDDHQGSCACGDDHHETSSRDHAIANTAPTAKRGAITLLVSGSLSPCPGAALFLLYGFHEGNPGAGLVAVVAISLGMWITLIVIGVASVALRSAGIAGAARKKDARARCVPAAFGVLGSAAVFLFAVLTVIPR